MTAIMVQGCTSWAGKSWLATALCRWYARQGLRVAPFKAQNMANNARVVRRAVPGAADAWGEIGTAQWLQALAAGVEPDTRMNPVLVKPESWTSSQVVVDGLVDHAVSRLPWSDRAPQLRAVMHERLDDLLATHDLVVIEGAGSPAEVNLDDQVNMAIAHHADAPVLLVADIDRGGAFAHLFGTWSLVSDEDRERLAGFVLNRFRGDAALLAPAPELLRARTGVPVIGTIPMVRHGLPDEDGAALHGQTPSAGEVVGIVRYPTASNLDEYARLEQVTRIRWVHGPGDVEGLDLLVLPGSKHVVGDATWLDASGVGAAVVAHARAGRRLLGICGGLQLLGRTVDDPHGVDGSGAGARADGLALLDVTTTFGQAKVVRRVPVGFSTDGPWAALDGQTFDGYEIRHGDVRPGADARCAATGTVAVADGPVLGILAHGLFEDARVLQALFGSAPITDLDHEFELLADIVDEHLDTDLLRRIARIPA